MTTIYLSSTYEDLKNYREIVYRALRKSGCHVIAMEDYVAQDKRPVEACLRDIDKNSQIYVGIFAFRYGYIPPVNPLLIARIQKTKTIGRGCRLPSWSFAMPT